MTSPLLKSFCLATAMMLAWAEAATWELEKGQAPVDNPLKGLVPYMNPRADRFPHSMEFFYIPLSEVVIGPGKCNWAGLDRRLDDIASRGHQAVFRFYLEYPGKSDGIPPYLIAAGLEVHPYLNTNTSPFPPDQVITPDYENPDLRKALTEFIGALGERYDGDPRIGFITAGLLGTWGEWHTYPREELFASKKVQREVMDAYTAAFRTTPILLRYPAGKDHETLASNSSRAFGYHDDSFAWATLDTGREEDDWFFLPTLRRAGPQAVERWKTHPIGGEIRPEAWGVVFDAEPPEKVQDFDRCVRETHVSWLMDSGLFEKKPTPERKARALEAVRRMGYEFRVGSVTLHGRKLEVTVHNQGIAPFYHPWRASLLILGPDGREIGGEIRTAHALTGILPGQSRVWEFDLPAAPSGDSKILLRVANPLPKGKAVGFANRSQNAHREGWLSL
ncbi:MAG: hypothetical protein MUF31_12410 [Akkermansiaceae bacterium]|jgi:hypothetical protein|nr:hypothetical protein [Akkermansiaceae bacterium]